MKPEPHAPAAPTPAGDRQSRRHSARARLLELVVALAVAQIAVGLVLVLGQPIVTAALATLGIAGATWFFLELRRERRGGRVERERLQRELGLGSGSCLFTWTRGEAGEALWFADEWTALGLPSGELASAEAWLARVHTEDLAGLVHALEGLLAGRESRARLTFRLHLRDEWRWVELHATALARKSARALGGAVRDVTVHQTAHERLTHAAFHDPLTGLANRALLLDRLGHCAARARRNPRYRFALVYLDIDGFKVINDSLGHVVGDEVLQVVATRLQNGARPGDTVARIGGDEFCVLLEPLEHIRDAERVATRIRCAVQGAVELHGHHCEITTSIGIALSNLDSLDPLELLRDADTAMYHAKRLGPGRQHVFDQAMHDTAMRRLQVESELRRGLENGGLVVHYQPIVDLETGAIEGFEGLARLTTPSGTIIGPGEFVPIAETQGLVDRLLEVVLEHAAGNVARWSERHPSLYVSVNVSARSVHAGLVDLVSRVLARHSLPTRHIKLELTESVLVGGSSTAVDVLSALRGRGIGLYIDDFGTGYSSLSYLHQLPADRIKLDRSFVSSLDGQRMPEIVQTIVTLSQRISAAVIAEGIETQTQLGALRRLGCTLGQGYYFAPALPQEAATRLLDDGEGRPFEVASFALPGAAGPSDVARDEASTAA